MTRHLTPLLLILSLIGNGLLAPWAMAAMLPIQPVQAVENGQSQGCHGEAASAAASEPAAVLASLPGPQPMAKWTSEQHPEGEDAQQPPCCEGDRCHCGCILPSLLAQSSGPLGFAPAATAPKVTVRDLHSLATGHPPFRPPAA